MTEDTYESKEYCYQAENTAACETYYYSFIDVKSGQPHLRRIGGGGSGRRRGAGEEAEDSDLPGWFLGRG